MKRYSDETVSKIIDLHNSGKTIKYLAEHSDISESTIRRWIKKNNTNTNLFDPSEYTKKSRPMKKPAKDTDATPSIFGWEFQIVTAIILSIKNINNIDKVIVEGRTEDIELYFDDKLPEYVQAKAIQEANDNQKMSDKSKLIDGLNTLLNTSNIKKGKYSSLLFICNYMNPLRLSELNLNAYWSPTLKNIFFSYYDDLPPEGREYVDDCFEIAKSNLGEKYNNSDEYFYKDRLIIATNKFHGRIEDQKDAILDETIGYFLLEICKLYNLRPGKIKGIRKSLKDQYFDKATIANGNFEKNITKIEIIWNIIIEIMEHNGVFDYLNDIPVYIINSVRYYEDSFLNPQARQIETINKVLSDFTTYSINNRSSHRDIIKSFYNDNWDKYKEFIPGNTMNKEEKEWGIKYIIVFVILNSEIIHKIKKGGNYK